MAVGRSVVCTVFNGESRMGLNTLVWRYPNEDVVDGSLLTVESNEIAIVKSRGAIMGEYEFGQHTLSTSNKPLLGSVVSGFFNSQQPGQVEVFFVSKAKHIVRRSSKAYSSEMAELSAEVDYYFHVPGTKEALELLQHLPMQGRVINVDEVSEYATPVIEQAINQIVQVTPLEMVNEKIHEITQSVETHLADFLKVYGIKLDTVKVLIYPNDPLMKQLISFRAFGMTEKEATQAMIALKMAERGLLTAPNALIGQPFNIGGVTPVSNLAELAAGGGLPVPAPGQGG